MSGLLRDHPLAELIHEISGARLAGALRLARERVRGAVYFDGGYIVGAHTNLRAFRLTEALRRTGAVTAEKLAAIVSQEMSDDDAASALVSAEVLTNEELRRLRERLAAEVLRQLLQWTDGEWNFDPRVRLAEGLRVRVDVARLLFESARDLSSEFAARSLRDNDEKISPAAASPAGEDLPLLPAEAFVLSRLDAPLSFGELVAVCGLPEDETRRAVYVLMLGGLVGRERPRRALPEAAYRQAVAPAPSPVTAPPAAATTETGAVEDAQQDISEPPAPETAAPAARDPREELAELYARAEAASHYEVLGVSRLSRPEEIKRAYHALARRFHPDRFRREVDEAEQQRLELSFATIAKAYETLKDPKQRAAYDLKLSAVRSSSAGGAPRPPGPQTTGAEEDPSERAEERFQQGLAALRRNDHAQAIKHLGEAVLLVPRQARYRAFYGRALACEKATRRQAETEIQSAIALDVRNVTYRVMLAELYRDVGLRRRAETELEQALAIDGANRDARRLLDELRRAV